jgi:hypothetical protein
VTPDVELAAGALRIGDVAVQRIDPTSGDVVPFGEVGSMKRNSTASPTIGVTDELAGAPVASTVARYAGCDRESPRTELRAVRSVRGELAPWDRRLRLAASRIDTAQLTAFFTSAAERRLVGRAQLLIANDVGPHRAVVEARVIVEPERRIPALNLSALWKKQTTLPSLAYAGIPYQSFGDTPARSPRRWRGAARPSTDPGSGISAIFASTLGLRVALFVRRPSALQLLRALLHRGTLLCREGGTRCVLLRAVAGSLL